MSTNTRAPLPTPRMVIDGLKDAGIHLPYTKMIEGLRIAEETAQREHIEQQAKVAREMAEHDAVWGRILGSAA